MATTPTCRAATLLPFVCTGWKRAVERAQVPVHIALQLARTGQHVAQQQQHPASQPRMRLSDHPWAAPAAAAQPLPKLRCLAEWLSKHASQVVSLQLYGASIGADVAQEEDMAALLAVLIGRTYGSKSSSGGGGGVGSSSRDYAAGSSNNNPLQPLPRELAIQQLQLPVHAVATVEDVVALLRACRRLKQLQLETMGTTGWRPLSGEKARLYGSLHCLRNLEQLGMSLCLLDDTDHQSHRPPCRCVCRRTPTTTVVYLNQLLLNLPRSLKGLRLWGRNCILAANSFSCLTALQKLQLPRCQLQHHSSRSSSSSTTNEGMQEMATTLTRSTLSSQASTAQQRQQGQLLQLPSLCNLNVTNCSNDVFKMLNSSSSRLTALTYSGVLENSAAAAGALQQLTGLQQLHLILREQQINSFVVKESCQNVWAYAVAALTQLSSLAMDQRLLTMKDLGGLTWLTQLTLFCSNPLVTGDGTGWANKYALEHLGQCAPASLQQLTLCGVMEDRQRQAVAVAPRALRRRLAHVEVVVAP